MRTGIVALTIVAGTPAFAESSLGITGATLSFAGVEDEAGDVRGQFRAAIDVAVTNVHGLQGDLSFEDTDNGLIGRLAAHAYMAPVSGQKYGLFFAMSDVDGRSLNWISTGVEGQIALGDGLVLGGRAGLGRTDRDSLDYIFGGASLAYAVTESFEVEATLDLTDFDETDFRATSVEARLNAIYSPNGQPWGVYASVSHSDLTGRDGLDGEMRLGFGLTMTFGNAGGVSTDTRPFRDHDAVAALVRRGLK